MYTSCILWGSFAFFEWILCLLIKKKKINKKTTKKEILHFCLSRISFKCVYWHFLYSCFGIWSASLPNLCLDFLFHVVAMVLLNCLTVVSSSFLSYSPPPTIIFKVWSYYIFGDGQGKLRAAGRSYFLCFMWMYTALYWTWEFSENGYAHLFWETKMEWVDGAVVKRYLQSILSGLGCFWS